MEYNEFSRTFRKYVIAKGDKKTYVTHANMKGGSLHVPVSCRHAFLSIMADAVRKDRRPSLSERAMRDSDFRTLFFDLDAQSTDRNHVFMTKAFYYDIVNRYILPCLYECYTKEAIVKANIRICIAFPNCIRTKERVDTSTIRYKFGAHIRFLQDLQDGSMVGGGPYITVDNFDILRQLIVTRMSNDKKYAALSLSVLSDLFDLAPFESGGMRMLLNVKGKKKCKMHLENVYINECEHCNGTGEIMDNSFYSPERLVNGYGETIPFPWGTLSSINDYCLMWKLSSIYVPFSSLEELYDVFIDETQKLSFRAPSHYLPSADIRKRVDRARVTNDDGLTVHVNKRMKIIKAPKISASKGELLPNADLKEAMEAWIWAYFHQLYCNAPPVSSDATLERIARYHRDICYWNLEYLHTPNKWETIAAQLGCSKDTLVHYWKLGQNHRVQVNSVVRSNCDNYNSVIWVHICGPLSMRCGNAAATDRSNEYEHDSPSMAYFQFSLIKNEVKGVQKCFANNKGCECKNGKRCKGKKGTKQGYSSRPYVLPSWIGLGLYQYKPKELQVSSSVTMQGMIHTMNINLNKNGQFRSMRRIQWDDL